MSQGQLQKLQSDEEQEAITYGDVFGVRGAIASEPVASGDAAIMKSAERSVLGYSQIGGPASVMQAASGVNVATGAVDPNTVSDAVLNRGVTVTQDNIGDTQIVTEKVGGEVVGQYVEQTLVESTLGMDSITIGEALEAAAYSEAADKPIDESDAAAIKAAEVRAIGSNTTPAGGIGAQAQSAAQLNALIMRDENKTTLSDVLADASTKLSGDKMVTREDAEGVIGAEIRNKADMMTTPGGVAASMAAAARLNQNV
ncbi:late embryogenesis abundant protein D-34-like [Euphorbia lathyris]|uniref:late embryogenesis abundant protein D-34-like n=1 Tax=Euphorbia lathyris TaxID=212925 RepID=UPI003313C3C0